MKAYEMFCRDLVGNELTRSASDRKEYYRALRQQLQQEVASGAECELVTHFVRRVGSGKPTYLYLLDAAALWECYEAVIDGVRVPRDMAQGLPVPLESGRRLVWSEVQRLNDAGALPAVPLTGEMAARIQALAAYAASRGKRKRAPELPAVNPRAKLCTVEAAQAVASPVPRQAAAVADRAEKAASRAQHKELIARQQKEKEALREEKACQQNLKAAAPAVTAPAEDGLLEMILRGRLSEAAAEAERLGSSLSGQLEQLREAKLAAEDMQRQLEEQQRLTEAARAQLEALRARQREAAQEETALQEELRQARADAEACQRERQAAEAQLNEARAELKRQNAALRQAQRRLAQTSDAALLTRRQAERLS